MISIRFSLLIALTLWAGALQPVHAEELHTASAQIPSSSPANNEGPERGERLSQAEWSPIAARISGDLCSESTQARQRAARVAASHGSQGMGLLLNHLRHNRPADAAYIIPHLAPANAQQRHELVTLLDTPDPELHALLTSHLAAQEFETLESLVQASHQGLVDFNHTAEVLRRSTEWGYGWIEGALHAGNPDIQGWLALVGALDNPVFLGRLDLLFKTGPELLRRHVVRSWAQMDPHWVTTRLILALDDPRPSVQREALNGLRRESTHAAATRLMARIKTHGLASTALIRALGRTATPHAVREFKQSWPTASLSHRLAMLEAAANIANSEAVTFLFEGTVAHEEALRERAAELLRQIQ